MKSPPISRITPFILVGIAFLQSCDKQTTTPEADNSNCDLLLRSAKAFSCPEPAPMVPPVATRSFVARYEFSDSTHLPDSVKAATLTESAGSCSLAKDRNSSTGRIQLTFRCTFAKAVEPVDTVFLRMMTGTMKFAMVPYVHTSDSTWTAMLMMSQVDTVALRILERLGGAEWPRTDSGIDEAYASLLVAGETNVGGFPQTSPFGVDTAKVRTAALRRAVVLGKPLSEIVAHWKLDLDFANAKARILALVPAISSSDSAVLFP